MVHMQCTKLYYLLLVSVWRCIRLNHIYGDMDMPKIWANFLFVSFAGQEQKVWITIHKLNLLRLRVRVVFEEVSFYGGGYSYGFFLTVKFTFFPAGLAESLLINFRYFQILNNYFGWRGTHAISWICLVLPPRIETSSFYELSHENRPKTTSIFAFDPWKGEIVGSKFFLTSHGWPQWDQTLNPTLPAD